VTQRPDPFLEGVRPRQLPGMARLMPLTEELLAHYGDRTAEAVDMAGKDRQRRPEPVAQAQDVADEHAVFQRQADEPDPGVQPPNADEGAPLEDLGEEGGAVILADLIPVDVPAGWAVQWRVTGKDRLADRWAEQEFGDRAEAVGWARGRGFLLPRADGVVVRCALVPAEAEVPGGSG
jgi:hypothetical protein